MSYRLQNPRLWTKEELAGRATTWSAARGGPALSVATLLKWKEAGLLLRPTVRSLGRGRGSKSGWSWRTYRIVLVLMRHRHAGLRRLRDLRIAMWFGGHLSDSAQVRADLDEYYSGLVEAANRNLHTEFWELTPTPRSTAVISRELTGPRALERMIQSWKLDPVVDSVARLGLSVLVTGEGQRLAVAVIRQFFAEHQGDVPDAVKAFQDRLPPAWRPAIAGADQDLALALGLLAHPDGFINPVLAGLSDASAETMSNLRETAILASKCWNVSLRLAAVVMTRRPGVLGPVQLMAPLLSAAASKVASRSPFRSPSASLAVMALGLANPRVHKDHGRRLTAGLRTLTDLGEWLVRHPDVVDRIEDLSDRQWLELGALPDFPATCQPLLESAREKA